MTLHHARKRVEMACTTVASELLPKRLRRASRTDGRINIGGGALCDLGQHLARRRLERCEVLARVRRNELTADEMSELPAVLLQPSPGLAVGLGSRTVLHGLVVMRDAHQAFIPRG